MRRSDGTRLAVAISVLVACAAIGLFATWWIMGALAGDECAWIAGFGGCR
jgi:hypothetical protein